MSTREKVACFSRCHSGEPLAEPTALLPTRKLADAQWASVGASGMRAMTTHAANDDAIISNYGAGVDGKLS